MILTRTERKRQVTSLRSAEKRLSICKNSHPQSQRNYDGISHIEIVRRGSRDLKLRNTVSGHLQVSCTTSLLSEHRKAVSRFNKGMFRSLCNKDTLAL